MAEKDQHNKKVSSALDHLRMQVDDLYKQTYYTGDNSDEIKSQVTDRLDDAIRISTQGDEEFQNISNTSKLFRKILRNKNSESPSVKQLNKSLNAAGVDDISTMFQNPTMAASIMDSYSKTKWITELDNEYDMICKYMTKLQTALDIKRDAVLCSDSYTKRFLNVRAKGENPSSSKNTAIQNNIEEMIRKYDLSNKTETWYDDTSKYGEEFVYCVPYKTALDELLKRKTNTHYSISESSFRATENEIKNLKGSATVVKSEESGSIAIKLSFDKSKVLMEAVKNNAYLHKAYGDDTFRGLSESYVVETNDSFEDHLHKDGRKNTSVKLDKVVDDELYWEDDDKTAASGLTDIKKSEVSLKVNGAILRVIKHDKIIPIYIEDVMFGAYYVRFSSDTNINSDLSNVNATNTMNSMFNKSNENTEEKNNSHDMVLRRIAGEISNRVDAAFINSNTDLKKEIYLMLRFNDMYNQISDTVDMDVVFIPADDIHHLKFREDPETHRGISDLWDALVPAKQWITLTLTTVLGIATRGFDHRVYYVKQSLDTNTAQSILNVISTIKKGNFGVRQMESVNNILNVVGRFNDFVIPVGPSGDPPIQFDTMPGQQFEPNDTLLTNLESSAVDSTGVPLEIVNSATGMDFAVRYTMTNAKLLRNVLKRQLCVEEFLSKVFSKIYKFEYNEAIELEVTLPPPAFLSMTQGTQLLNSAVQYADSITEIEMSDSNDDAAKALFKKKVVRKLIPSYLTDEDIKEIRESIAVNKNINKSDEDDDYMSD